MAVKRFKLTFTVQSISLKGHKWNLYFAWRKMCEMVSVFCVYLSYTHSHFTVWSSVNWSTAEVNHTQGFCMCVASLYRGCIDKPSSLSVSLCMLQKNYQTVNDTPVIAHLTLLNINSQKNSCWIFHTQIWKHRGHHTAWATPTWTNQNRSQN